MSKGYSTLTVRQIESASPHLMGVRLGRLCVKLEIPVKDIAEHFQVSRVTVYSWFRGERAVSGKHAEKMQKLIEKLK